MYCKTTGSLPTVKNLETLCPAGKYLDEEGKKLLSDCKSCN
jgi:hypothetical protein